MCVSRNSSRKCHTAVVTALGGAAPHAGGFTVGHVVVLPQHAQHALLPMSAAELVPDDRVPVEAGLDVGPLQALAAGADDGDLVDDGRLAGLVLAGLSPGCNSRTQSGHNVLGESLCTLLDNSQAHARGVNQHIVGLSECCGAQSLC